MKIFWTVLFFAMFVGWLVFMMLSVEALVRKLKNTWYVRLLVPIPVILLSSVVGGLILGFLMKYLNPFWNEVVFYISVLLAFVISLFIGDWGAAEKRNALKTQLGGGRDDYNSDC